MEETIDPVIINMIIESVPVGLLVIDSQGGIVVSNLSASTILGYSQDAVVGKGWAELFLGQEENRLFNQVLLDVIWEERLNLHRIVPYTRPDGSTLYLSVTTSFIKSARGLEGITVLLDDITELHTMQIHEKIILKEKESLQRDRSEGLHKLAMAIAHQVRNPITAIGGLALRMLKAMDSGAAPGPYLQNILSGVKRLEAIVTGIQEYTQLPPVSRSVAPITTVLDQVEEHARARARSLNKHLELGIDSQRFDVKLDCHLLVQALNEILDNAIEFGGNGSVAVHITASRNRDGLSIKVGNNGTCIPMADLPYIFDPFFTTKAVGVGMGLCKVKRIVSEHGGQVWAEKAEGQGTIMIVQIPYVLDYQANEGDHMSQMVERMLNNVIVLNLRGRLDASNASDLKDKVKDCLKKGHIHIVIDLAEIDFVDSSGLGSLVACLRTVNKAGGDIRIAAVQDRVRAVFELIRLHHVFEIYEDSDAAAGSYRKATLPAG